MYPVVGVSYEGAEAYCQWLQSTVQAVVGEGYMVTCKLPNHHEWLRAARGDRHGFVYVWGGPYIQNALGRVLCNYSVIGDQSLSRPIGSAQVEVHHQDYLGVAGYLNDNADITAPGISYAASDFGCYNMNGNVAELMEGGQTAVGGSWRNTGYDVRCESTMPFVGPNCYVGFRPMLRITPVQIAK
jgi:formylglycine-generating enzyme required for sulfatase activity